MHPTRAACFLLSLLCGLSSCGKDLWTDGPLGRRFHGPVRVIVTSALIAPGKNSGRPWDGTGSLPTEVAEGLRSGLKPPGLQNKLFWALANGTGLGTLAQLLPWTANTLNSAWAAPDVEVSIALNGRLLLKTPRREDSYNPTWAEVEVQMLPIEIHDMDRLEFHAIDRDVGSVLFGMKTDDEIGVCTHQGMPWVDEQGYATGEDFRCSGQLWAIGLRIVPAGSGGRSKL